MSLTYSDAQEIVFGLVLNRKLSLNAVRPDLFTAPYNKGIKLLQERPETPVESLIERVGFTPFDSAIHAAKSLNGSAELDWVSVLEKTKTKIEAGVELEKISRKLVYGGDVDTARVKDILTRIELNDSVDKYVPLAKVKPMEIPFKPCGWKPIDNHLGGIPEVGLITLLGYPGTGKTSAAIRFAKDFVKEYPDKYVLFFTLEMLKEELAVRMSEIEGKLTEEQALRILIFDEPVSADRVVNISSTIDDLGLVIVDFADYLCQGELSESNMTQAFMSLAKGTKLLRTPIMLLAQPNRSYQGGVPRMSQVYMTSAAEKATWMFLSIYNPHLTNFYEDPDQMRLPLRPGRAMIVCWKCRGGFRKHPKEAPGAIEMQYLGKDGFRMDDDMGGRPTQWHHVKTN